MRALNCEQWSSGRILAFMAEIARIDSTEPVLVLAGAWPAAPTCTGHGRGVGHIAYLCIRATSAQQLPASRLARRHWPPGLLLRR
jgi:hypothetical protein